MGGQDMARQRLAGARIMEPNLFNDRLSRISTCWSLVFEAHQGQGETVPAAQQALLRRYCGAVYRYLVAAVRDPNAADDLAQEFSLRFIRGDFRRADPERGRFRDFVKTALYHLVVDYHRRRQKQPAPLPEESAELPAEEQDRYPGDQQFLELWRQELLDRAWEALAEVQQQTGGQVYTVLRWRAEHPQAPASELAGQLTAHHRKPFTDAGIRQILNRARKKFADLLLEEVARSLETAAPERLEQELIDLGLLAYCRSALQRQDRG
jgi:RNA polymerase sigma-70 factor (ECF subfamily)